MLKSLFNLKRNDVNGAIRVMRDAVDDGTWKPEYVAVLMRLQDDTSEIAKKLKQEAATVRKALPKLSDEQRADNAKGVGAKTLGAESKVLGEGGKVRYNYPGEKGGDKKPATGGESKSSSQSQNSAAQPQDEQELPHPDLPSPEPDQSPIAAEHPDAPDVSDPRAPDPTESQTPKHTINVAELCVTLNIKRDVIAKIVSRMQKQFGNSARQKFVSFMSTHLGEFAEEHGLEGDYFGLLYDVMTGKVPEGQPASVPAEPTKPAGSVAQ